MDHDISLPSRRGRAARYNPATRFGDPEFIEDPEALDADHLRSVPTEVSFDHTRAILARNDSPDVGFTFSVNPYRGCEHGCIYCYARPSHEYLGFSAGLDFERRILVKRDAPALLEAAFERSSWQPQTIALSGNTDPYQPLERRFLLSRGLLEVFARYRNPVSVITKNYLVTRDMDLLSELASLALVRVTVSVTTLDAGLASVMEPRTSTPARRLDAIRQLSLAGIPAGVNVAPVIPGLTDEELPRILEAAAAAGATHAGYQLLRLPGAVKELFLDWLRIHYPDRSDKVIHRLADLRGPSLTDTRFHRRMKGSGVWAETLRDLFVVSARRYGLNRHIGTLNTTRFRRPSSPRSQLDLFGDVDLGPLTDPASPR